MMNVQCPNVLGDGIGKSQHLVRVCTAHQDDDRRRLEKPGEVTPAPQAAPHGARQHPQAGLGGVLSERFDVRLVSLHRQADQRQSDRLALRQGHVAFELPREASIAGEASHRVVTHLANSLLRRRKLGAQLRLFRIGAGGILMCDLQQHAARSSPVLAEQRLHPDRQFPVRRFGASCHQVAGTLCRRDRGENRIAHLATRQAADQLRTTLTGQRAGRTRRHIGERVVEPLDTPLRRCHVEYGESVPGHAGDLFEHAPGRRFHTLRAMALRIECQLGRCHQLVKRRAGAFPALGAGKFVERGARLGAQTRKTDHRRRIAVVGKGGCGLLRRRAIVANQNHVAAGAKRHADRVGDAAVLAGRGHRQVVGENNAVKTQPLAQVLLQPPAGKRRGQRVTLAVNDMRGHDSRQSAADQPIVRQKIGAKVFELAPIDGQLVMRVRDDGAMAREMFPDTRDSRLAKTTYEFDSQR